MYFSLPVIGQTYFELADSKKDDLKFLKLLPSDVVPSGKRIKFCPFNNFFCISLEYPRDLVALMNIRKL